MQDILKLAHPAQYILYHGKAREKQVFHKYHPVLRFESMNAVRSDGSPFYKTISKLEVFPDEERNL